MTPGQNAGNSVWRRCLTFVVAAIGGFAAYRVSMPLPWVIGSMIAVALFSLLGDGAKQPALGRRAAQVTIGTALGLYFTQDVIREVASFGHWMVLGAAFAIALTMLFAPLIQRMARLDGTTAIYAVALGASAEMAMQAQKAGANAALVASAHAIRIILVVSTASFIAYMTGAGNATLSPPGAPDLPWQIALVLAICAPLCGWALHRVGMPNAWVLGPIFLSGGFAAWGMQAKMYQGALIVAQVMIGWGLGQHMTRKFFVESPRMLMSSTVVTLSMLFICLTLSWGLAEITGINLLTSFLSVAPGGMAEMAIIAKAFGIGAPIVTAFHFFRIVSTIFLIKWVARVLLRSGWVKAQCPLAVSAGAGA
jgi:membrane AbrB-like protein